MLNCYPNRPQITPEYTAGLLSLLVGKPIDIVNDLPHPTRGVSGIYKSLPSIAGVKQWLYDRLEKRQREIERNRPALPEPEIPTPTPEERERARLAVLAFKQGVKALVDKASTLRPPPCPNDFGYTDDDVRRMSRQALANLEGCRPKAETVD